MAVSVVLSEIQRDTLQKVCDTYAPSIERADDPDGFWARAASDIGVPDAIEQMLAERVPEEQVAGLRELLDAIAAEGFSDAAPAAREQILKAFEDASFEAKAGVQTFKGLTLMLFYALPDEQGQNPNWKTLGYPGPRSAPPDAPKPIRPIVPPDEGLQLEADVCVVGSGAGGGLIAGTLAKQGKKVAILEMGGYYNEADFNQLELWAYENLYHGGSLHPTADGQIVLMAGANLGGGTTVNWTNSLRTTPWVREEWEKEFGLEGLAGADYDRHLDAVFARLSVNDQCDDHNGPHQRMLDGAAKLGYKVNDNFRNTDPATYTPESSGFMGFGDQSGSKQGTLKTYLMDAHEAGADFVVRCRAERVLTESGRATGVEGTYVDEDGRTARVVVRAPQVVVACGALESPALLLRSGIGGPAVGDYLRLHPATGIVAVYDEPQKGWWSSPQTATCDEFADIEDGYGFLLECSHASTGSTGSALPWDSGAQHKELMSKSRTSAGLIFLIRDRGHGRVTIDRDGNGVPTYPFDDELDQRMFRRGLQEAIGVCDAAGANELVSFHRKLHHWKRGEDLDAFTQSVHNGPLTPYDQAIFSAHQMGSCRMGSDRATSVANPWGELHDTPGVWVGDASAFPTASGTNPMITIMALAHRTAEAMAAA